MPELDKFKDLELNNLDLKDLELKKISDSNLNEKVKSLASQERNLLELILTYIAEVDRRELFLKMAHPSLFDYLREEIGYSAGAAQRRIDGARLMQKIPEVSAQINSGSINLGQISKLQRICRLIKKESGKSVQVSQQKEVLSKLENQNMEKTDIILAQEFKTEVKVQEVQRHFQRDGSVRVELTFSRQEMELIKRAQALLSHKTGGGLKDTLLEMAKQTIRASEPKVKIKGSGITDQSQQSRVNECSADNSTATVAVTGQKENLENRSLQKKQLWQVDLRRQELQRKELQKKDLRKQELKHDHLKQENIRQGSLGHDYLKQENIHQGSLGHDHLKQELALKMGLSLSNYIAIRLDLKKQVLYRDQCCQFKDPQTGKVCGSKYFLEVDHILPKWAGGNNSQGNLQLLCKNHNIYRYKMGL